MVRRRDRGCNPRRRPDGTLIGPVMPISLYRGLSDHDPHGDGGLSTSGAAGGTCGDGAVDLPLPTHPIWTDLCTKSSITRPLTQKERDAVANNLRQIGCALVAAAILGNAPAPILEISPRGQ